MSVRSVPLSEVLKENASVRRRNAVLDRMARARARAILLVEEGTYKVASGDGLLALRGAMLEGRETVKIREVPKHQLRPIYTTAENRVHVDLAIARFEELNGEKKGALKTNRAVEYICVDWLNMVGWPGEEGET